MITDSKVFRSFGELFKPGGGEVLKNVLYGKAPPRGPTLYLLIIYHFWQKIYPFRILSIDLRYPFHIPSLELCIAFTAVIALSLKCWWINHKTRTFSQPQNVSVGPSGPAFCRPKWPISLPFQILQQVKSIPFHILTWRLRKVPISGGGSPYRPL